MGGHVQLSVSHALACSRSCSCSVVHAPTAIATPSKNNLLHKMGREIVTEAWEALASETVENQLPNAVTPRFIMLHIAASQRFTFSSISCAKYIYYILHLSYLLLTYTWLLGERNILQTEVWKLKSLAAFLSISFQLISGLLFLGMQQENNLKIRIEPGLFEWTKWVSGNTLPAWIPPVDLAAATLSVDTTYR